MAEQFKFSLPDGTKVFTGMHTPTVFPLSFSEYPEADLFTDEQIRKIISNPLRRRARDIFKESWLISQGRRSSCNAYMAAGMLLRIRYKKGLPKRDFAPEWAYANINGGRDQGSMLDDGMRWMGEHGMPYRESVPYEMYKLSDMNMEQQRIATQEAAQNRFFETHQFPRGANFWRSIISAILRGQQVGVAVHVGNRYMNTPNRPLVEYGLDVGPGNHAVGVDDVIDPTNGTWTHIDQLRLDQYGSWTSSHAENGRGLLRLDHLREPLKYHAMYATRSVTSADNETPPTLRAA